MTRKPFFDLIVAAGFLLVALGAYAAWYHVVGKASAEAASLRTQLEERGAAGGRAAEAKKILAELSGQEASVYGHLVSSSDIVSFLETVQATGRRLGAKVEIVSVANVTGKQDQVQLAIRISGPFDAVMRTLGALEYQKYSASLSNLTLESQGPPAGTWAAAATFIVGMTPASAPAPVRPAPPAATASTTP